MKKPLIFIKLGGSVITNKEVPESVRYDVLDRIISEVAQARKEKNLTIILGNGAGSFAHMHASQYRTMEGFISPQSRLGMAITQDSAARLNRIVVAMCLKHGMPALTLAPSNTIVTNKKQPASSCLDVIKEYLEQGMLPVAYGDVLVDRDQGCTIWSTDTVFNFLVKQLHADGYEIESILHVTQARGVWKSQDEQTPHQEREIYSLITPDMCESVCAPMTDPKGFDVTGGMKHKIEESVSLAKLNIDIRILSGEVEGNVYQTLMGDKNRGTLVTNRT